MRTGNMRAFLPTVHSDACTGFRRGKCEKLRVLEQPALKVLPLSLAKGELDTITTGWLGGKMAPQNATPGEKRRKAGGVATVGWCYAVSKPVYGAGDVSAARGWAFGFAALATTAVVCRSIPSPLTDPLITPEKSRQWTSSATVALTEQ